MKQYRSEFEPGSLILLFVPISIASLASPYSNEFHQTIYFTRKITSNSNFFIVKAEAVYGIIGEYSKIQKHIITKNIASRLAVGLDTVSDVTVFLSRVCLAYL